MGQNRMNDGREKRRYQRFSVDSIHIYGKMLSTDRVKLLDLSLSGASVEVDRRMNIGNDYRLKMEGHGMALVLKGRVVWSTLIRTERNSKGEMVPIYRSGLQFSVLSAPRAEEVIQFIKVSTRREGIEDEAYRLNNLRCTVRYDVGVVDNVVMDEPSQYPVKVISLGGMLLLSDHPFDVESRYPMEIVGPGGVEIRILGRVAFCEAEKTGKGMYEVGVEFLDTSAIDRATIEKLIASMNVDQRP